MLVVKDSKEFATSLLSFFDFDEHTTDLAPDLSTADDFLAVSKFDIILLDIILPDGDGRDFLKKIRGKNIAIPFLYVFK